MKIIFIDKKTLAKEKILEIISNDAAGQKERTSESVHLYNSSFNLEDLLKEIKIENEIINSLTTTQKENGFVIVIDNDAAPLNSGNSAEHRSGLLEKLEYKKIKLNLELEEVYANNHRIKTTALEFKLLLFFMNRKGKIVSKKDIIDYLWGSTNTNLDLANSVYTHVKNLKKKLTIAGSGNYIQSVYGQGYKFQDPEESFS